MGIDLGYICVLFGSLNLEGIIIIIIHLLTALGVNGHYASGTALPLGSVLSRAAKLSLWNFLSLFRDLKKPTRFSGGGG